MFLCCISYSIEKDKIVFYDVLEIELDYITEIKELSLNRVYQKLDSNKKIGIIFIFMIIQKSISFQPMEKVILRMN